MTSKASWSDVWASIPTGSKIFLAGSGGEPTRALDALAAEPDLGRGKTFTGVWLPGINRRNPLDSLSDASADVFFMTPALRTDFARGLIRFRPLHYTMIYKWLAAMPGLSTAIVQVSPPQGGKVSLGLTADFTPALLDAEVRFIGEVNPALPSPKNAFRIPVERFDALVASDSAAITYDAGPGSDDLERIAEIIAGLIEDGDTVQFGLGKVQAAAVPKLADHRNLGWHGGMLSDPVRVPLEAGTFAKGLTTGVAVGSLAFYDAIVSRSDIVFCPVPHTHGADALARIERFFSVGSAIELDLFGQVNSEMVSGRQVSGHGGLAEFLRGAIASPGGRSVIALPSTASNGSVSRIRPALASHTVCSAARADIDMIVTEFGVAQTRTKDIDARAEAIVSIAHPSFRDKLGNDWDQMRRAMS